MTSTGDIASENFVMFVRSLRSSGIAVTTTTTQHLVEAAVLVGMDRGSDVREAFRAVVVTRRSQNQRFDEIFDQFFSGDLVMALDDVVDRLAERKPVRRAPRIGAIGSEEAQESEDRDDVVNVVGGS